MNQKKNGFIEFFKSKGFYLVLVVCVVAAAVSSYLAVDTLMTQLAPSQIASSQKEGTEDFSYTAPVAKTEKEVPIQSSSATLSVQAQKEETKTDDKPDSRAAQKPEDDIDNTQTSVVEEQALTAEPLSFVMPVNGEVINDFSSDELVYNATMADWRTHNGIDIAAAKDAPVVAAVSGKIVKVLADDIWGGVVDIDSNGVIIRYAGLNPEPIVRVGQSVVAGETIGRVGELPGELSDLPHIHIEAEKSNNYFKFTEMR